MTTVISFGLDEAMMKIVDLEKPDEFVLITSPLAEAALKGCTPIQSLGATQTYVRRYLYLTAFDIIESDALDSSVGDPSIKKDADDFKKEFDGAKTVVEFSAIKKELQSTLKDVKKRKEVIDYATAIFEEKFQ